ncbi:MAG: alpha/beta hydrolase [Methylococcaceae bacterium]
MNKFSQFGSDNGRVVIYFHGAPGAPEECAIFNRYGKEHGLRFICFDRFSIDSSIAGEAYYQFLAKEISKQAAGEKVDVIGFSIGAFIALQTCRYLANGVKNLHLISAAAPLDAGDFLDTMAGKQVFQLAKTFPILFVLLSYWQELLALFFPNALFRLLFASAAADDKALAADREFQSSITKVLRSCFIGHVQGYTRDIRTYVRPWATNLSEIAVNTHIWHGADDNWSPVAMAKYLESAIPGCVSTEIFTDLSHYSCLYRAAPEICHQLGAASGDQRVQQTLSTSKRPHPLVTAFLEAIAR